MLNNIKNKTIFDYTYIVKYTFHKYLKILFSVRSVLNIDSNNNKMRHRVMWELILGGIIPDDCGNKNNLLIIYYLFIIIYCTYLHQTAKRLYVKSTNVKYCARTNKTVTTCVHSTHNNCVIYYY